MNVWSDPRPILIYCNNVAPMFLRSPTISSCHVQPYELTVGAEPGRERKRDFVENANGLFSAQAAPKPPPALYSMTEGMRVGGRVSAGNSFTINWCCEILHDLTWTNIDSLFKHAAHCNCTSRAWIWAKRNQWDTGKLQQSFRVLLELAILRSCMWAWSTQFLFAAWSDLWYEHRIARSEETRDRLQVRWQVPSFRMNGNFTSKYRLHPDREFVIVCSTE